MKSICLWVIFFACLYPMVVRGEGLREEGCSQVLDVDREGRDYVYLLYNETVMRTGPGKRYSACRRYGGMKGLPFLEYVKTGAWHLVWDFRGVMGWVHESQLQRAVRPVRVVRAWKQKGVANVYGRPREESRVLAYLVSGYLVRVEFGWCDGLWCRMEARTRDGTLKGWMKKSDLWGFP